MSIKITHPIVFASDATSFASNGLSVLHECISCPVSEDLNGGYELELVYPMDDRGKHLNLVDGNIIKADGQPFRIYYKKRILGNVKIKARHIFYDLLDNFLEDVRPTNANGASALDSVLTGTQYAHNFISMSDVTTINTRYFIRQNPVEAIMGNDGIIKRWGGELERDNYTIKLLQARGADRGILIAYRKNIIGIEETLDTDGICTRLMPIGKDGLLLPEKYVDSPYINNYPHPKIRKKEFTDIDNVADLRAAAQAYMTDNQIDIPPFNYAIDFVELTKTEEYKNYSILETVYLGDTVTIRHSKLGINLKSKVINIVKDAITGKTEKVELGSFKPDIGNITTSIQEVKKEIVQVKSDYQAAIDSATNLITGTDGGNIVFAFNEVTGQPEEILIMDTDNVNTALKVWRWNVGGLGFSSTGIDGPYTTAITQAGAIVADFITAGALSANMIKAGWNGIDSNVKIDSTGLTINNGHISIKNSGGTDVLAKTADDVNLQKLNTNGATVVANGEFLDASQWTAAYSTLSVSTVGELKCAAAATKNISAGASQVLSTVIGHKYYIACDIKPLYSRAAEMGFSGRDKAAIASPTINVWNRASIISTANSINHSLFLYHDDTAQYATSDVFRFRAPIVVDLTALYGAGNEPTKEWCDLNIVFGNLAKNVAKTAVNQVNVDIDLDERGITVTNGKIVVKNSSNADAFFIDANGRASTNSSFCEYDQVNGGGIQVIGNIIFKIGATSTESKKMYLEADEGVHVKNATGYSGQGTVYKDVFVAGVNFNGMWQYKDNTWMYIDPALKTGGELLVNGVINATGVKYRIVKTSHGTVGLCAYEMADPMFGDIGEGKIVNGECIISIDPIFAETVLTDIQYHVFLQKYGQGDVWVSDRQPTHFVVKGTEGLTFSWEIKAKQVDNGNNRMKVIDNVTFDASPDVINYVDNALSALQGGTE